MLDLSERSGRDVGEAVWSGEFEGAAATPATVTRTVKIERGCIVRFEVVVRSRNKPM